MAASRLSPQKAPNVSFEFFPPATLQMEATLWDSIERLAPLPRAGKVQVRSRLLAVHPRGKGNASTNSRKHRFRHLGAARWGLFFSNST